MAKLKLTDSQQRAAKRKVINLTVIGAAAAALAVSLSSAFYSSEVAETVATEPKSNVHQISNFELPTIQLEDKYSAINDAMADKMETTPKTRNKSFQSPNLVASTAARGAPSIDPMDLINWEKLRKLDALLPGTTSTRRGFAET